MKEVLITFATIGASIVIVMCALIALRDDRPALATVCANSKAQVELLNLCGHMDGCHYDQETLRKTMLLVAQCEVEKIKAKP